MRWSWSLTIVYSMALPLTRRFVVLNHIGPYFEGSFLDCQSLHEPGETDVGNVDLFFGFHSRPIRFEIYCSWKLECLWSLIDLSESKARV